MSSILAGFQMLNDSIRGVREDKRRHEERMHSLRMQKQEMDYKMNDPRVLLERQKAAEQMEEGALSLEGIGRFNDPDKKEFYNVYTRPAIVDILDDEGLDLGENGEVYYKGTNNIAQLPKWKRDSLESSLKLAAYGSRVGNDEYDLKLHKVNTRIKEMEDTIRKEGKGKEKILSMRLGQLKADRDDFVAELAHPDHKMKRLIAANSRLTKVMQTAMQDPDIGDGFYNKMLNMQKQNTDQIESLQDLADTKDLVKVEWTRQRDDGTMQVIPEWISRLEANNLPMERQYDTGNPFVRGRLHPNRAGGGDGGPKTWKDMTQRQRDAAVRDYTNIRLAIGVAEKQVEDENIILEMLGHNWKSEEEKKRMVSLIRSNSKKAINILNSQLLKMKQEYAGSGILPTSSANANDEFFDSVP